MARIHTPAQRAQEREHRAQVKAALIAEGVDPKDAQAQARGHARGRGLPGLREVNRARQPGESRAETNRRLKAEQDEAAARERAAAAEAARLAAAAGAARLNRRTEAFTYGTGNVQIVTHSGAEALRILRSAAANRRNVIFNGVRRCGRGAPVTRHEYYDARAVLEALELALGRPIRTGADLMAAVSRNYPDPDGQDHPVTTLHLTVEATA